MKVYWIIFFVLTLIYGFIKRYLGVTFIENGWIEAVVVGSIMGVILTCIEIFWKGRKK